MATLIPAGPPIMQFFDNAGKPNVGGSVLTQVGGVDYATYQDAAGNIPLPNPIPLNSRGEASSAAGASVQVFLDPSVVYTFTLYDNSGNLLNQSNYVITGAGAIGTNDGWSNAQASLNARLTVVADKAAAQALTVDKAPLGVFITSKDGGPFYRDALDTTSAEDGGAYCGTVIRPADYATNGVYKRVFTGYADVRWWGAFGSGDDAVTLQQAITACAAKYDLQISLAHTTSAQLNLSSGSRITAIRWQGKITYVGSMATANALNGVGLSNVSITNLGLVGDLTANATAVSYGGGVHLTDCNNVTLRCLDVSTFPQKGIYIDVSSSTSTSQSGLIQQCTVDGVTSIGTTYVAGVHGISLVDGVQDWTVDDCDVTNIGTPANNTGGIGIITEQLNAGWITPDAIRFTNNRVNGVCQHGIAMYASQLTTAEFHPLSKIENNVVKSTGLSATVGGGGAANSIGNGIYCEQLIPGAVDCNITYNTHVAAVSTTIADSAIALMVNTASAILEATVSISGNSSSLCNRGGLRLQRISGFSVAGHVARQCKLTGLQLDGCKNFTAQGTFTDSSATGSGLVLGNGGLGTLAAGCSNFNLDLTLSGFVYAINAVYASEASGKLNISGYTSHGYFPQICTNVSFDIYSSYVSDHAAVYATTANTNCTVKLTGPNRTGSTNAYIYNASTGLRIEFEGDSIPAGAVMAFGVGDICRYRAPTAGAADYARCVTGGVSGTYVWKSGAALSA